MIKYQTYSVGRIVLTKYVIAAYIENFWTDVFSKIENNGYLLMLFKVKLEQYGLGYRTIGQLRAVSFDDKALYINYIWENLNILDRASDIDQPISQIIFSYIERTDLITENRKLNADLPQTDV